MKILLVEDRTKARIGLCQEIVDAYNGAQVVAPENYSDTMYHLTTGAYDFVIIDMSLDKWVDFTPKYEKFFFEEKEISCGLDIAALISQRFNLSKDRIIIYSAYTKDELMRHGILSKKISFNEYSMAVKGFNEDNIISKIDNNDEDDYLPNPSYKDFYKFNRSLKLYYYKRILAITNSDELFRQIGDFAWIINRRQKDKIIVGKYLKRSISMPSYEIVEYEKLSRSHLNNEEIPNIIWNFKKSQFLSIQSKLILKEEILKDEVVGLFFSTSFAHNIGRALLNIKNKTTEAEQFYGLLSKHSDFTILETQNEIIRQMAKNGDAELKIKGVIGKISQVTGYAILDLFDGILDSYNQELDIAWVTLINVADSDKTIKKQLAYKELVAAGVEYKESSFFIWIYADNKRSVKSYFIEKNF